MNKLKKLFSPRALATTIATGMLLHATVALAASTICFSQLINARNPAPSCANGTFMCDISYGGYNLMWCCPNTESCYDGATPVDGSGYFIVYCVCQGG